MAEISYKQLDKLLHKLQGTMWAIQRERQRHDKKEKKHIDDLLSCRAKILKWIDTINGKE